MPERVVVTGLGVIAPNADEKEDPRCPRLKVMAKASFGFGDVNACNIFRKFEP